MGFRASRRLEILHWRGSTGRHEQASAERSTKLNEPNPLQRLQPQPGDQNFLNDNRKVPKVHFTRNLVEPGKTTKKQRPIVDSSCRSKPWPFRLQSGRFRVTNSNSGRCAAPCLDRAELRRTTNRCEIERSQTHTLNPKSLWLGEPVSCAVPVHPRHAHIRSNFETAKDELMLEGFTELRESSPCSQRGN